ncbi:thaumatin-like protein [Phtheirospermum japonicum]|uniref:Thaumatin-like protein n=1 Tax=Phtheirospermum japonicum TaxID=374723 RepID=A0A830BKY0_9LAMI|nr:thaumatin-like protein [Phtheirospermum japonicum]
MNSIAKPIYLLIVLLSSTRAEAATFTVRNNCPITVWAAVVPGGGRRLDFGQTWTVNVSAGTTGQIWARTGCLFDREGQGRCQTGDCNGQLQCRQPFGAPPNTQAAYSLNRVNDQDFFVISLVNGFNVPMGFSPNIGSCTQGISTVFRTDQYCCDNSESNCGPTDFSRFFKDRCPNARTYPRDNQTNLFNCSGRANNYNVVFCPSILPGGGRRLGLGETWTVNVPASTTGRIWARTGCFFDRAGLGRCLTGDCKGLLQCRSNGAPPNTLAEYSLNQSDDMDFFDVSLVEGFNVPIGFSAISGSCQVIRCVANINGQCPRELRAPGGCNNPCTVYRTDQYCCNLSSNCGPTPYSRFFKGRCPNTRTYPRDDDTGLFTCDDGAHNYRVVFCP